MAAGPGGAVPARISGRWPAVAGWAGAYAFAETLAGLLSIAIAGHDRADWTPFLACRPWLLAVAALLLAARPWRFRLAAMALGLAGAALGGALWLAAKGAGDAIAALRIFGAGILLLAAVELVLRLARWAGGRRWRLLAAALLLGLALLPGAVAAYERVALGPLDPPPPARRPPLHLLSGLPLIWSEGGVAETLGRSRPLAAMLLLRSRHDVLPLAAARPRSLAGPGPLLAVQPRIDAEGLVAVDDWVRRGGRMLLLADPDLRWPTRLPPGDPARPPGVAPLLPLLAHWGLALSPAGGDPLMLRDVEWAGAVWRVRPGAPGRLASTDGACAILAGGLAADCRIGQGRAVILADADLLDDDLWVGMGSHGTGRFRRTADNGPLIAAILADLGDGQPVEPSDSVVWIESPLRPDRHWLLALLPSLLLLAAGLVMGRRGIHAAVVTKSSQTYPQAMHRYKERTVADFRHRRE